MQRKLTDVEIAWLAGLYEGEGTTWAREYVYEPTGHVRRSVRVSIAMTDLDIVERVDRMFPSPSGVKVRARNSNGRKTLYYWNVSRRDRVAEFLTMLLPHLGERRASRAREVLAIATNPNYGMGSQHRRKTHCKHGHEFTPENTTHQSLKDGKPYGRRCKTCCRIQARAATQRRAARKAQKK